jgi:pyruvate dehydrogenase E1 component alpha subunit
MTTPAPKFAGAPRQVVEPPLARAEEFGIHQRLTRDGEVIGDDPTIDVAVARRIYETMVTTRLLDERGWELQRSGRVEFWIPMRGQEASHVASTAAYDPEDWLFIASREAGAMLWRGAPLVQLFAQIFGRSAEPLRGRRLPLLFGDRSRFVVPCTTQVGAYIPHAAGAAWAAKLQGHEKAFIVFFGDGATSRGEFHSALNFAGVHRPPILFFCQNNGWAVSTPNSVQTATTTFAEKAAGYGLPGVRVDGNDFLALWETTRRLRERSLTEGPTLVESVTYRQGFHTSSDNPDLYRTNEEAEAWAQWDPIHRARRFLERHDAWDADLEEALVSTKRAEIRDAIHAAEALPKPDPSDQFFDVLATPDRALREQLAQLTDDLKGAAR